MLLFLSVITDDEKKELNKLIIMVRGGDKRALSEIYRIAGGRMLSIAMGLMRNKQLAEDILHDSFIKVARFCSQYKENTNAYAWLCTIVRNTALNKIKSENLTRTSDIDEFFNLAADNLTEADSDRVIDIENAMKMLKPRERTAIWLKYYNDMTVREIAKELDMPRSSVGDIILSAEKKLKDILKKYND